MACFTDLAREAVVMSAIAGPCASEINGTFHVFGESFGGSPLMHAPDICIMAL
jgi:hypothetical protein